MIALRPDARQCAHVDGETGERCITILCSMNPGPDCFAHTRTYRRPLSTAALMRANPTPTVEAIASGLRELGVKVAA